MNTDIKKLNSIYTGLIKEGIEDYNPELIHHDEDPNDDSTINNLVDDTFLDQVMDNLKNPSMKFSILLLYLGYNIVEAFKQFPEIGKICGKTVMYDGLKKANEIIKNMCEERLQRNFKIKSIDTDHKDLTKLRVATGVKLTNRLINWAKSKGLESIIGSGNVKKHVTRI